MDVFFWIFLHLLVASQLSWTSGPGDGGIPFLPRFIWTRQAKNMGESNLGGEAATGGKQLFFCYGSWSIYLELGSLDGR